GWGWAANRIAAGLPGTELLLLAPFLVAQVLCWVFFYDAERAFHDTLAEPDIRPYWTRWAYVGYHIRQNLALVCIPVALLILDKTVRRLVGNASPDWQAFFSGVRIALVLGVFLMMPWLLRLILRLQPLADGPLRQRLLAACQRLRFRCSNILVWNTRGG